MNLRLIRHATLQVEFAGRQILVDQMFAEPRAYRSLTVGTSAERTLWYPCRARSKNCFDRMP